MVRRILNRGTALVVTIVICSIILAFAVLSPFVLNFIATNDLDWTRLAAAGQAYGGASAVLSGLAFLGIAVSLILQWRQHLDTRFYELKRQHFELVKLTLEDPRFLYIEGPDAANDPDAALKVYANLTVSHWAMHWDVGAIDEKSLRTDASRLFAQELVREWWAAWGASYLRNRHRQRFVAVLNEELVKARALAQATRDDVPVDVRPATSAPDTRVHRALVSAAMAFTAGVALGILVRATRRDPKPRA